VNAAKIAREVSAVGYLDKPFTVYQAWAIIETALQAADTHQVSDLPLEQERALRVLVLTEQRFLAEMIKLTLNHGVFASREVRDVDAAGAIIRDWRPHLAVVDLDGNDDQLLRRVGSDRVGGATRTPVLAVTRRGDLKTKLAAFDQGADDVMTMPLSPEELLARVLVITRRSSGLYPALKPVLKLGDLEMDILNRTVRIGSSELHLTGMEQSLLYLLAANAGEVLTRDEILDALWGADYETDSNVVDRHIASLRAKLQNAWGKQRLIVTVPGQGYRFLPLFREQAALS